MLLMIEKGIRRGICHSIYLCAKDNDQKKWKIMIIENRHIFDIGMKRTYMDG